MSKSYKCKAKESRKNIGNEHGTIVKTWFRHKVLVAFGATFIHVKGVFILKRPSRKQVSFMAPRTFYMKDRIKFSSFFKHAVNICVKVGIIFSK